MQDLFSGMFTAVMALMPIWGIYFIAMTVLMILAKGKEAFRWKRTLVRSARVNVTFLGMSIAIIPFYAGFGSASTVLVETLHLPSIPESTWSGIPAPLLVLGAVVAMDFVEYWEHRFKHTSVLWPLHAVHHSDTELNYLSSKRLHMLDLLLHHSLIVFLGLTIGLDYASVFAVVGIREFHQHYVHSNTGWHHGPFELLVASPQFHRWHHADYVPAHDKNYALIMPLWDKLFGTYYNPGPCHKPTGFEGNPGDDFVSLVIYPFKEWSRMLVNLMPSRARKDTAA